jgi:hypothetical protein
MISTSQGKTEISLRPEIPPGSASVCPIGELGNVLSVHWLPQTDSIAVDAHEVRLLSPVYLSL